NTPTGPTGVFREDASGTYTEAFTMTATPHLTNGAPDGTEAISGLQTLTRDYTNSAGQITAEDAYFNLGGLTYITVPMGTLNLNYSQPISGYDSDGRLARTQTPNGPVPASSATLLVTNYIYNAAGWVQDVIDPMSIDDRTNYDNLGRVTQTIQD